MSRCPESFKRSGFNVHIMITHNFAANGKRDIHGVEKEFDTAINRLENTEKWQFENNRQIVLQLE